MKHNDENKTASHAERIKPMRKRRHKWLWLTPLILAALVVAVVWGFPLAVNRGWFNPLIERKLTGATGFEVKVGRLHLSGWRCLSVEKVTLKAVGEDDPFVKVENLVAEFRLRNLMRTQIDQIRVGQFDLKLRLDEDGNPQLGQSTDRIDETPGMEQEPLDWNHFFHIWKTEISKLNINITTSEGGVHVSDAQLFAEIESRSDDRRLASIRFLSPSIAWELDDVSGVATNFSVETTLTVNPSARKLDVDDFRCQANFGQGFHSTMVFTVRNSVLQDFNFSVQGADIEQVLQWIPSKYRERVPLESMSGRMDVSVETKALFLDERPQRGQLGVNISTSDFACAAILGSHKIGLGGVRFKDRITLSVGPKWSDLAIASNASVEINELALGAKKHSMTGKKFEMTTDGRFDLEARMAEQIRSEIRLPDLATINIENAVVHFGESQDFRGDVKIVSKSIAAAQTELAKYGINLGVDAKGDLMTIAQVQLDVDQLMTKGRFTLSNADLDWKHRRLDGETPQSEATAVFFQGASVNTITSNVIFSAWVPWADWQAGTLTFEIGAKAESIEASLKGGSEVAEGFALRADGSLDFGFQNLVFNIRELSVDNLAGASIKTALGMVGDRVVSGDVHIKNADVAKLWQRAIHYAPQIQSDYSPSGKVSVSANFFGENKAIVQITGDKLSFVSGRIDLPSGIEDLRLSTTATLEFAGKFQTIRFQSRGQFSDAVAYHDKVFKDFTGGSATMSARGDVSLTEGRLNIAELIVEAAKVLGIHLKLDADFRQPSVFVNGTARLLDTRASYNGLVKETFQELVPTLKDSFVDGDVVWQGGVDYADGQTTIRGTITFDNVSIGVAGMSAEHLNGDVPLTMQLPAPFATAEQGKAATELESFVSGLTGGSLTVGKFSVGPISVEKLNLSPLIAANRFALQPTKANADGTDPVALGFNLFGGRITVTRLITDDLLYSNKSVEAIFELNNIQAAQLFQAFGFPVYQGTVSSSHCRLVLNGNDLTIDGTITASICGGSIVLSKMRVFQIYSAAPVIGADVDIKGVDLRQLTSALPGFGIISGVLEGHVRNVLIQEGRPYSMDLDLRVIPRKGVKQWIDKNAVQSVVILSTGEAQPAIQALLVFGGIEYKTFGIKCRINDDNVVIEGTRQEGNTHIVLDSAFTSVPRLKITVSTGRPISYDDVVSRIQAAAANARKTAGSKK